MDDDASARADVEGLLHAILYGSSEYNVIAEDLEGRITVFSEGARATYGYAPEEVIGRANADILFAPEEIECGKIVEILNEAMKSGRCEAVVMRLRKNGERFPARATFTVRRDGEGDPNGFVVVDRDLSVERSSAKLTETAAWQVTQLQDHLQSVKAALGRVESDAAELRLENTGLRERAERAREADELNAIRIELIKDLRRRLERLVVERNGLASQVVQLQALVRPPETAHACDEFARTIGSTLDEVLGISSIVVDPGSTYAVSIPRERPTTSRRPAGDPSWE